MSRTLVKWPNGTESYETEGTFWLEAAKKAGVVIPTGCLGGSCGACEIEVNGKPLRACVSTVLNSEYNEDFLNVEFSIDPYW